MRKRKRITRPKQQRVLDQQFIASQLNPFRQALQGGVGKMLTFSSGRFNPKAYSRCSSYGVFDRKNHVDHGKPKIALIVDCSGSMGGYDGPIDAAAEMCAILSRLHQSDSIEARVFCTGSPTGPFQVPMPQSDMVWEHLMAPHGQEYLSQTFLKFRHKITECDLVACYTDADIADRMLSPKLWRTHGKSCVGLYCGDMRQLSVMRRYFDHAIAREEKADLFLEYLRLVKRLIQK